VVLLDEVDHAAPGRAGVDAEGAGQRWQERRSEHDRKLPR
jgi:hypothetical protein